MADWAGPILLGLSAAIIVWTVWYFTKAACTTVAATNGLCNPGIVAHFLNVEILLQSGGAGLAVGALKGGYDRYMLRNMLNREREALNLEREAREQEREALNREREAREQERAVREQEREALNQELAEERKRANEAHAMVTEMFNEFREERRQDAEQRQQEERERQERRQREEEERREEHRVFVATQEALLQAVTRLMQQSNGRREDSPET